jgi:alpha-aminoadipic semialdehyde synthase
MSASPPLFPADHADEQVPLGYKFSWSPKAVLTAALNPAQYKLDNTTHSIPGDELLKSHFPSVPLWKGLALEGLANRDSLPYADKYGMGKIGDLKNLFRGTLRYVTKMSREDRGL